MLRLVQQTVEVVGENLKALKRICYVWEAAMFLTKKW